MSPDLPRSAQVPSPAALSARERLIVALDFADANRALALVEQLGETVHWYKVGLELFVSAGPDIVTTLVDDGHSVFLDLKLHDIPNTVAAAVKAAANTGASLLTIHAAGGPAMIRAAADAAETCSKRPRLLAVTVLTSVDAAQLASTGIPSTPAAQVERLAGLAIHAGADGLVCSPEECAALCALLGTEALLVTPGIRPAGASIGDQKRIASPGQAIRNGASYLVVGRPITQAPAPLAAVQAILGEINTAMSG